MHVFLFSDLSYRIMGGMKTIIIRSFVASWKKKKNRLAGSMDETKLQDNVYLSSVHAMPSCGQRDLSDDFPRRKRVYVSSQITTLRTFLLMAQL